MHPNFTGYSDSAYGQKRPLWTRHSQPGQAVPLWNWWADLPASGQFWRMGPRLIDPCGGIFSVESVIKFPAGEIAPSQKDAA
jgi:hypothetical protein